MAEVPSLHSLKLYIYRRSPLSLWQRSHLCTAFSTSAELEDLCGVCVVEFASLYSLHLPKSTWQRSCLYSILCTYTRLLPSPHGRGPVSTAFCIYARSPLSHITVQHSLYLYKITESTWQRSCSYSTLCTGLYKIMESTLQRSCSYSILCTSESRAWSTHIIMNTHTHAQTYSACWAPILFCSILSTSPAVAYSFLCHVDSGDDGCTEMGPLPCGLRLRDLAQYREGSRQNFCHVDLVQI